MPPDIFVSGSAPEPASQAGRRRRRTVLKPADEPAAFAAIVRDSAPWDAATRLRLLRSDYRPGEILELGVNFFVLALQALGTKTQYSCEGHPYGFYLTFHACYPLARQIQSGGYFSVEIEGENYWSIRHNDRSAPWSERKKRQMLRWAAQAWVNKLFPTAKA